MTSLTFSPWILPGLVGAGIACLAGSIAWRRRATPGGREFVVLSVAVGWWCLMQVFIVLAPTLAGKVLLSKAQYLGIVTAPLAWFWFAVGYTHRSAGISSRAWALLIAPEVATLLLAWTNEWHGLVWESLALVPAGSFSALRIDYGAWFRLHLYYPYGLILVGTGMLVYSLAHAPYHKRHLVAVVAAPLVPFLANLVYLFRAVPDYRIDLTPSGLAVGGLVLAWALLHNDLLDVPLVARSRILETLSDGILVLDGRGRVIDLNAAAARLLARNVGDVLAEPFFQATQEEAPPGEPRAAPGTSEVVERDGVILEVDRARTRDVPGGGWVVIVRDVTERHRMQSQLREVGEELRRANQELSQLANTDALTGLANRRHFFHLLEQELRRATRYQHPLSLLLLDIDHFKEINDTYGHGAGDMVLRQIAEMIRESVREIDVVGRLGGDELAVALPETDEQGAWVTAQRLLERITTRHYRASGGEGFPVTASIGLAVAEAGTAEVEGLLHTADLALYRAKGQGRNQIHAPGPEYADRSGQDGGR